jgi:hypothetical protein
MSEQPVEVHNASSYARGCRCRACKRAHAARMADYRMRTGRTKQHKWAGEPRPVSKHGSRSKYTHGCRCEDCTEANRQYQRSWARLKRLGISWNSDWE